jgi:predicted transcriptional regulator
MLLNEVVSMDSSAKQTIRAQIPSELAAAVEDLAVELNRSKSWIVKEALTSMLAERERRHQQIEAGLADVDAGRVVSQKEMMNFVEQLKK